MQNRACWAWGGTPAILGEEMNGPVNEKKLCSVKRVPKVQEAVYECWVLWI